MKGLIRVFNMLQTIRGIAFVTVLPWLMPYLAVSLLRDGLTHKSAPLAYKCFTFGAGILMVAGTLMVWTILAVLIWSWFAKRTILLWGIEANARGLRYRQQ